MARPITQAGDPVLRKKAKKCKSFGPSLDALATEMLDAMHAADGLGLAAPRLACHCA